MGMVPKMRVTVTKQFKKDFDLCMKHYEVTGEELDYEKARCRENMEEATRCYESIADGLRKEQCAK